MSYLRWKRARYVVPAAVLAAVGIGAVVPTLSGASAPPNLPAQSAQQLVADMATAKAPQLSGTLTWTANLGLSDLSSLEQGHRPGRWQWVRPADPAVGELPAQGLAGGQGRARGADRAHRPRGRRGPQRQPGLAVGQLDPNCRPPHRGPQAPRRRSGINVTRAPAAQRPSSVGLEPAA